MPANPDDAWVAALAAIDRGAVTPAIERAVVEAARRVKRRQKTRRRHEAQRLRDALTAATGRVATSRDRSGGVDVSPGGDGAALDANDELPNARHCYVCKAPFKKLHPFYHLLCVDRAEASYTRRTPDLALEGRRAIVTGGRTKIGFQTALLLLRGGANVVVTTRYAHDAARRYEAEADYAVFAPRLRIAALDFRDVRSVDAFVDDELRRGEPLDILVNQAAQTIRGSAALEQAERERDRLCARRLGAGGPSDERFDAIVRAAAGAIVRDVEHGEWVDTVATNSWDLPLEDVTAAEFLEVQLVNVFAPYALTSGLKSLMLASRFPDRYIVQVSAIEGQFYGRPKNGRHAHTNMAKAALHMLVRTCAETFAREGLFMNAVDPGWVSDQSAVGRRDPARAFCPPLDVVDGAARIVDPIARGLRGDPIYGNLLKDFAVVSW